MSGPQTVVQLLMWPWDKKVENPGVEHFSNKYCRILWKTRGNIIFIFTL